MGLQRGAAARDHQPRRHDRRRLVSVEYFPNSRAARTDTIGLTDVRGRVRWVPAFAGIVSLTARRGHETVATAASVQFPSVPPGAVLVFLFAGTVLLGGSGWAIIRLFERDAPLDADPPAMV